MPTRVYSGCSGRVGGPDTLEPGCQEVVRMRGRREPQVSMLAFVDLESRVPLDQPLRTIKRFADEALATLSPLFEAMYADSGRPSIPPERLLKAQPVDEPVLRTQRTRFLRRVGVPPPVSFGFWTWTWSSRASTTAPSVKIVSVCCGIG